jgi:hypothetical protein
MKKKKKNYFKIKAYRCSQHPPPPKLGDAVGP